MPPEFEVTAVRVGTLASTRADTFYRYGAYQEPDGPLQMDYFFWVLRSPEGVVLLDTGFHPDAARRRGRTVTIEPVAALAGLGIEAGEVRKVIVSHFHYDHIGNVSAYPNATLVAQRRELDFWTGPYARHAAVGAASEPGEITYLADAVAAGRVEVVDGDAPLEPGIVARLVGGHCPGQQVIHVDTASGEICLATDALHLYEEMERDMPFDVFCDIEATYATYARLRELQARDVAVIAGHDPKVMASYPSLAGPAGEYAVRIA